jgi:ribose/xylose/arabinose/galactoside ABC-type transport system permease subunit
MIQNKESKLQKQNLDFSSFAIIIITVLLFLVLSFTSKTFLTYSNIYSIFFGVSFQFLAIIGFIYLMIMGEIDLSVGSVYAFSGMFVGYMVVEMQINLWAAIIISLIVCTLMGLSTGFIIVKLRLNSMMVTIATMTLIRGLASNFVKRLYGGTYPTNMRGLVRFTLGDIHMTIIVMIILAVVLELLLHRSSIFKKMYFVGENLETARVYGIKPDRIKIITFALSSFMAAVAGILINSRVTYADTSIGQGLEFHLLTAAVLGGASLYGGKGSILRSCVALIFLATILNGMIIFNIEPLLQQLIIGMILIGAVFIDTRFNRLNKL